MNAALHDAYRTQNALKLLVGGEEAIIVKDIVGDPQVLKKHVEHMITRVLR